jgi:hypothetical protein
VKLSVVMAVRNGEPYLNEAVESVLAQSVADFEFLISDEARQPARWLQHDRRPAAIGRGIGTSLFSVM